MKIGYVHYAAWEKLVMNFITFYNARHSTYKDRYLENYYIINPNREKFSQLFQNENFSTLRKLAKLIAAINEKFK